LVPVLDYGTAPPKRRLGLVARLFYQSAAITGLCYSGSSAYVLFLELSHRRAIPSTRSPLFLNLIATACFGLSSGLAIPTICPRWRISALWILLIVGLGCHGLAKSIGIVWE